MEKKKIELIAVVVVFSLLGLILVRNLTSVSGTQAPPKTVEAPSSLREQLLKAEIMAKRLPEQRKEIAGLEKKLLDRLGDMPLDSDHTWLSRQISRIAGTSGVRDVSQRLVPVTAASAAIEKDLQDKYSVRTWEVTMKAGYHELGEFLDKLERSNGFIEVKDIRITGNEPEGQQIVFTILYLVRK